MSHLPEKGDIKAACDTWNARVHAVNGGADEKPCGDVNVKTRSGEGVDTLRRAVGDLYDPGEFLAEVGVPLIDDCTIDILRTGDLRSAFATAIIQAAALGALMERARWQR